MDDALLRADCSACAGLCCVALAFDRGADFAFGKPAGTPCRHLDAAHRCRIHDALAACGMGGCARYDCRGAGQRATALFARHSWVDSSAMARVMFDAFRILREIHELIALLRAADALPLSPVERDRRNDLEAGLDPGGGWTLPALLLWDRSRSALDARSFLRGLAGSG